MLLFAPHIILSAVLVILLASNLFQRGFRSSWLLAMSGAGLAFAGLFFLRLRLPLSLDFSAWWAGEGLIASINFVLDGVSWQIALIAGGLVLAFFLAEVQRAMSAPWVNWALNLALAIACLFAVLAGDLLTLAFFWIVVDLIAALNIYRAVDKAQERRAALGFLPANITAGFLLLAAWVSAGYSGSGSNLLALTGVALRLGVFSSRPASAETPDQLSTLRLLPASAALVLLARPLELQGLSQTAALVFLLLPALLIAFRLNQRDESAHADFLARGFASIAIAAAAVGQPGVALAFGLLVLVAGSLLSLARFAGRWRFPVIAASVVLFSVFPFLSISTDSDPVWFSLAYIVIAAAMIAGWMRAAFAQGPASLAGEPWMRVLQGIGLVLVPLSFVLLAGGLAPDPAFPAEPAWALAIVMLVLAAALHFASRRLAARFVVPQRLAVLLETVISMRWLQTLFDWALGALGWVLRMMSRVLEGQAGVLWALLLIVLLISLASQFALGG